MFFLGKGSKPPIWIWCAILLVFGVGIWFDTKNVTEFLTLFSIILIITIINIFYWEKQ